MMTRRITPDHETANIKPLVQRDPAADKLRDRRRLSRAILGRYGTHAPTDTVRGTHVRTDGIKQVTRRLAVKRVRAFGRTMARWWKRSSHLWESWMSDRVDNDELENGR